MGLIVTGFDGSVEAKAALRWALQEAQRRGDDLVVLHAYAVPPTRSTAPWEQPVAITGGLGATDTAVDAAAHARQHDADHAGLARQRAEALLEGGVAEASLQTPGVSVVLDAVPDPQPARALVDRSRGANLVVIGSRGRGSVTGALLGSVSQSVLHDAHCPVVVLGRKAVAECEAEYDG